LSAGDVRGFKCRLAPETDGAGKATHKSATTKTARSRVGRFRVRTRGGPGVESTVDSRQLTVRAGKKESMAGSLQLVEADLQRTRFDWQGGSLHATLVLRRGRRSVLGEFLAKGGGAGGDGPCLVGITQLLQHRGVAVERSQQTRVVRSDVLLLDLERALVERCGIRVFSFLLIDAGKLEQRIHDFGAVGPEIVLLDGKDLLEDGFKIGHAALRAV